MNNIEMPKRIANLPQDERGYPIPWNVFISQDGQPQFTVNDTLKHAWARQRNLCPICGQPNDEIRWFVGGPKSAFHVHGWYMDLPGHEECEEYALKVCPYLATPSYRHRIDAKLYDTLNKEAVYALDLTQDPNRPIVFVMVGSKTTEISPHGYVRPGRPFVEVRYWEGGIRLEEETGLRLAMEALR